MQDNQQRKKSIEMNIKSISPLDKLFFAFSIPSSQIFVGYEPKIKSLFTITINDKISKPRKPL